MVLDYLKSDSKAKSKDIAGLLSVKSTRTKDILSRMIEEGLIIAEGAKKNRIYRLNK